MAAKSATTTGLFPGILLGALVAFAMSLAISNFTALTLTSGTIAYKYKVLDDVHGEFYKTGTVSLDFIRHAIEEADEKEKPIPTVTFFSVYDHTSSEPTQVCTYDTATNVTWCQPREVTSGTTSLFGTSCSGDCK